MRMMTTRIHIHLTDEGTDVWRPIEAIRLDEELFRIPEDTIVPSDENWEFLPGAVVRCEHRVLSHEVLLIAVESQNVIHDSINQ